MAHVAALYTVQVRAKRDPDGWLPLGDLGNGRRLADALNGYMPAIATTNDDGDKNITCTTSRVEGNDVLAILKHGQSGVAADIVAPSGQRRIRQRAHDSQQVKCGAVFRLPPQATMGWLALHVNNNRGAKMLLTNGIVAPFRDDFPELMMEMHPAQLDLAVRQAVEDELVDKVTLIRIERPNDRANASTDEWVRAGAEGKLELEISTRRGARLIATKLARFLHGETGVYDEIVMFENMKFDRAKVTVEIPNVGQRTFNLEKPEAGHPITEDLQGLHFDRDGDPTDDSLFGALRDVLGNIAG